MGDTAAELVGREEDLALIRSFLGRVGSDGDALLLLGEPGVGKTLLLDVAAEEGSAAGMRVLRATGVQFEAELSFAGLNQALLGLHGEFARLDDAHRDALSVALGFGEGSPPDRFVVSNATLSLLRRAALPCPLLLIIDDIAWLDRASAGVLRFVARRLAGNRVGFLAASRSGETSFFERAGLREHELRPIRQEAAGALLSAHFAGLAPRVHRRVLEEAAGNPLALLELPAALSGPQRAASAALPSVLPLTDRLQALFRSQLADLSRATRRLLLLAALDGTGDLRVLEGGGARDRDALEAAERERIVFVDQATHRLVFRHPLVRSAVVEFSSARERRLAHRSLADLYADQPDRQAWHLAEATIGTDDTVAQLLEQAAERIARRGDAVGAVATLMRASELSALASERSRRLAKAAFVGANVTGELRNASRLLADARRGDPGLGASLQTAIAAAYLLLNGDGDVDTAHRLLVGAIESTADVQKVRDDFEEALHMLRQVCFVGGRIELWEPFYAAMARLGPDASPDLYLASQTTSDPARTAASALCLLETTIAGLVHEQDPSRILRTALAAVFVDRLGDCRDALWRVVRDGRDGGAIASSIGALMHLAFNDFWTGEWDQAQQLVDEGIELCRQHGYRVLAFYGQTVQACLTAARGDYDTTQRVINEMMQWALPRGVQSIQWYVAHALGLAALGRGDFEEAYQQSSKISPAGTLASHVRYALYVPMDLVEAAVRTDRHAEASAHVNALHEAGVASLSSRLALVVGGSAALAADGEEALRLFDATLALPDVDRWPFELARVRLAYGERLRRAQAPVKARPQLVAALATFERLGAKPWAVRAAKELRASGEAAAAVRYADRDSLTAQEHEIAMLAAAGLTNKQIGQQLFLSPRTVGAHLYRVFPKLGITSRAALRDALVTTSPPHTTPDPRAKTVI